MTKFIAADPTEERHLPGELLEFCEFVKGVEELTGADFIITNSKVPINERTLKVHIAKGIGVQRKEAPDFLSSFQSNDGRLWRQLMRMLVAWPPSEGKLPYLVTVGFIGARNTTDDKGNQIKLMNVERRETQVRYGSYSGALRAWQRHGGYYEPIPNSGCLALWCNYMLRELQDRDKDGGEWTPTFIPRTTIKPLEILSDVETTLMTIPGIGMTRARAVYARAREMWDRPSLIDCFRLIKERDDIEGIGPKTKLTAIKYIGWKV